MKQRFTTLIVLAGLVTMLAGCSETFNVKKGDQVRFTVSAMGNPSTKTSYAGYSDGNAFEKINWVSGDSIRIFTMNPEIVKANWVSGANHPDYYDYKISSVRDSLERYSKGTLTWAEQGAGEGYGLVWVGSPKGATFYGVYPSAEPQYDQTDATKIVAFSGMTIPASQGAAPNMKYAYMISEPSVYKDSGSFDEYGQSIPAMEMRFYPFFNAFYIELKSESGDLKINSVTLSSTSTPLAGNYKYLFQTNNGIPTADNVTYSNSDVTNSVTADLTSLTDAARTASATHAVAVTLLTLPPTSSTGLTNMTLTVNYDDNKQKSLALNNNVSTSTPTGTPISFKPFYKTRITGLAMKGNKWQLTIDDQVLPWIEDKQSTSFRHNIGIRNQLFDGYILTDPRYIYEDINNNILRSTEPYYEGQAASSDNYYYLNNGEFTQNGYYLRLTTKIAGVDDPCITYTFTPTAPIGGYWSLAPEAVEGSLDYFRITVDDGINGESERLHGQVMGLPVTIYIRPTAAYLALDNAPVCSCIIKCNMSPSATWDPLYSADSEFQGVHTDGTFSYYKYRIAK